VELLAAVFPHLAGLRILNVSARATSVRVYAEAASATAECSACSSASGRVHSRYERRLLDGAVGGREVVVHLRVRRFFCVNTACAKKIFVEQIEGVSVRYARQSVLARRALEAMALALGGRAGQRLGLRLAVRVGRMTLIRLIRRLPVPAAGTPRVLGVDDFSLRRGHRYGTIIVDMLTHRPVDVLDDRSADTFAGWLQAHPGAEIICRDRGGSYAEGAARAAPEAVQVADRWHLLKNLSDAVEKAVAGHRRCLQPPVTPAPAPPPAAPPAPPGEGRLARRVRARHAEVHQLRVTGLGVYAISRRLGLDPKTVRRYADVTDAEQLLGQSRVRRNGLLEAHKTYLQQRCAEGVTGTGQLLAEIQGRGYRGGERTLRRYLIAIRGTSTTPPPPPAPPNSRTITSWIMRPPAKLNDQDTAALTAACDTCPDLATIRNLARGFTDLVRERGGKRLKAWIEQAQQASIPHISAFATGLYKDWNAVIAGLTTPWSSGAVEGNVNRVKMIKRQMYGRANSDLLRRRILLND
jgi:transposase